MRRVLFLGQKPIGERCFSDLLASRAIIVCGVCSNSRTDVWWDTNDVYRLAKQKGIPFIDNAERNEAALLSLIERHNIDCLLSVQHAGILPPAILDAVSGFAFNLHCAPLPEYKGYNACNHAILNGETYFAATLHWMDREVDAGDAAFIEKVTITLSDTAASLYNKTQRAGLLAFNRLLGNLESGAIPPRRPLRGEAHFYPRSSIDELRSIRNPDDPLEVDRKTRAFWFPPFEPAYIETEGKKRHLRPDDLP